MTQNRTIRNESKSRSEWPAALHRSLASARFGSDFIVDLSSSVFKLTEE
ncbi:hypothetical protein ABIE45_003872 [Methylobacterium sp. OAE515]